MKPQLKRPREFVQDVQVRRMCVCLCFSVNHTLSDRQFTRVYVQVKSAKTNDQTRTHDEVWRAHTQGVTSRLLPVAGGDDEGSDGDGDGDREADARDAALLKREQAVHKREVKADAAAAALKADEDEAAFKAGGDAWMDMLLDSGRVKEKLKDEHTLKQLCSYALELPGYEPARLMGILDEYKAECLDEVDGLASDIVRCALPVLSVVRRAFSLSHFAARVGRWGI